jgi:hypothetical protein
MNHGYRRRWSYRDLSDFTTINAYIERTSSINAVEETGYPHVEDWD